jgi:hypothetical protein
MALSEAARLRRDLDLTAWRFVPAHQILVHRGIIRKVEARILDEIALCLIAMGPLLPLPPCLAPCALDIGRGEIDRNDPPSL